MAEAAYDHVVIARTQAVDVLRNIDPADFQFDPEIRQIAFVRQQHPLELCLNQQEFELHRLAGSVQHAVVLDLPTRFSEQPVCLALLFANHTVAFGTRQLERFVEHLVRNLAAKGLENLQFVFARQAA